MLYRPRRPWNRVVVGFSAMNEFGTIIGDRLHAKRWTQVRLAHEVGCTSAMISAIVRGERQATPDMATKIGEALDLTEIEMSKAMMAGARDAGWNIEKAGK